MNQVLYHHEDHLFGLRSIRGAQYLASGGPGGTQHAFEGQTIYHISEVSVPVLAQPVHRVEIVTSGHDYAPRSLFDGVPLLLQIDGSYRTDLLTDPAPISLKVEAALAVEYGLVGHGLGREGVDGLSPPQSALELRHHPLRAFFLAEAAAGAHIPVHVGRMTADTYPEIPCLTGNLLDLRVSHELDSVMVTYLDGAGRQDALRTVQRGIRLRKLGHATSNRRQLIHQYDFIA